MTAALEEVRRDGKTAHTLIGDVWRAQRYKRLLGLECLAPWQVQELDEEWLAVLDGLAVFAGERLSEEKAKTDFERTLAQRRAQHPTYRKY